MIYYFTTSNQNEYLSLKSNLEFINVVIEETRNQIHPSFRCILIEVNETIHLLIKVHFSVLLKHNMIWLFQNLLSKLGVKSLVDIKRASIDYLSQIHVPQEAVYYGDQINDFYEFDLHFLRITFDINRINQPLETDLTAEYRKLLNPLLLQFQEKSVNLIFKPFEGHRKHYIFTSSNESAEMGCNVLMYNLYSENLLPGNEVLNVCFTSESAPKYGLHEVLEQFQGHSIKIMFFEDFNLNSELRKSIIINMVKDLLKEFGKTILFTFFFHDKSSNIQQLIMDDHYPFDFVIINNRDLNYEEACDYIKKESYKYWIDEDKVLGGLNSKEGYSRIELKQVMMNQSL